MSDLDARTFQSQLDELTTTIAYKVQREGAGHGLKPDFLAADFFFILRQAQWTYNLFRFINADERRKKDTDWRVQYSAVILPLVRTIIDCFYNISSILQNPGEKGHLYRASGFKRMLEAIDSDERRYAGDPRWDAYIVKRRTDIDLGMRGTGFTETEVRTAALWPTLSAYLASARATTPTPHQQFFMEFAYGFWQEYSAISHATFQGLPQIGIFLAPKDMPHDDQAKIEDAAEQMIAIHVARVAAILLCTLTEIQVYCRFEGANINRRLHQVWRALIPVPEIKKLYDGRFCKLMEEKGILPD